MPWWKQFLYRYGNYLLAIISPILFLILLEGSFWLIPSKKTVDLSPLFLLNPFWEQHNLFQSDPYLFWTFRPNQVIYTAFDLNKEHQIPINSLGLRGLEYNAADYKDSYRILCLGDSCTFCWEVVFRDGYPEILQRDLRITYPDKNVRVINAGVPGYASFQMVRMYRKWNTFFKPDLIVFWSASNDAAEPICIRIKKTLCTRIITILFGNG
jgi:hypothetical protein